jgi:hypothetical protein
MSQFCPRYIVNSPIPYHSPISIVRQKNELGVRVNKAPDEPWARYSVNFHSLAGDPSHGLVFLLNLKIVEIGDAVGFRPQARLACCGKRCVFYLHDFAAIEKHFKAGPVETDL